MSEEEKKEGLNIRFEKGGPGPGFENDEACFIKLDRAGDLLSTPGCLQYEAAIHPKFGPIINAATNKMMHAVIDGVTLTGSPEPGAIDGVATGIKELSMAYMDFLSEEIGQACLAMQIITIPKLLLSIEKFDTATGVTPEAAERLAKSIGANDRMIATKPHPSLGRIIVAGIKLAGGDQETFAHRQVKVMQRLPDIARQNPSVCIPTQICGAILEMLSERMHTPQMVVGQIVGVLESVLAAKRFTSLPFVADWHANAQEIAKNIFFMAEEHIKSRTDLKKMSDHVADTAIDKMMKSATQPGNETKH